MESSNDWPFDQGPNVAAITTRQVIDDHHPIRQVVHYDDDHSWAFLCGTTEKTDDYKLIGMHEVLKLDPTIRSIANLPPGWSAWRDDTESPWERQEDKPS